MNERRNDRGSGSGGGGRRGGRGGRGGKSGGGGGGEMNREVAVSKALSKLLRHAAEEVGLAMDAEGFARVDQVVRFLILFVSSLYLFVYSIQASQLPGLEISESCYHVMLGHFCFLELKYMLIGVFK